MACNVPIRLVIADDHLPFRLRLKSLLEREGFTVLGEGSDGFEAIKLIEKLRPDITIVTLHLLISNV